MIEILKIIGGICGIFLIVNIFYGFFFIALGASAKLWEFAASFF